MFFGHAGVQLAGPWSLSPKVIHWIYRMIICLVITYSSVVCWTRVRLDSAERELTKLQTMVCIAMTGHY